jgi:DNA polymerase IV
VWAEPILHVDMDSFFVEVERLIDASLRGRPVAVGGTGKRGVIASASYEAREFGVRSAMPTATALRLCRNLTVVAPSHGRYGEVSGEVFAIFRSFTPYVEGLSMDEAFLDVKGLRGHYESSVGVARDMRVTLRRELGLPASVGIAATKFVAKLASEKAKPDGIKHVPRAGQAQFIHSLPIDALWGVGPATLAGLSRLGVVTTGDLVELPRASVISSLGPTHGAQLLDLANGIDPRPVVPDSRAKSLSVEETFAEDLRGRKTLEAVLQAHSQRLSGRLRRAGLMTRTISVKVRYSDFSTATRSITVDRPIWGSRELLAVGRDALAQHELDRPVRLLGLGAATLQEASGPRQMGIDDEAPWDKMAVAVAGIRDRFGDHAIEPARLLDTPGDDGESDL